jgi:hypothetical protein
MMTFDQARGLINEVVEYRAFRGARPERVTVLHVSDYDVYIEPAVYGLGIIRKVKPHDLDLID